MTVFPQKNSRTSIDYLLRIIPPPSSFPSRHLLFLNDEAEVQSDQEKPISDDSTLYAENKHVTILFFLIKGIIKQDVWGKTSSEDR